jgi:hypothetical protein
MDFSAFFSTLSLFVVLWSVAHAVFGFGVSPYPLVLFALSFSFVFSLAICSPPLVMLASLLFHAFPLAIVRPDLSEGAIAGCFLVAVAHMTVLYVATGETYLNLYGRRIPDLAIDVYEQVVTRFSEVRKMLTN